MLKIFRKKKYSITPEREEYLRLIKMAEDHGIYVPGASRKICERREGAPRGSNYTVGLSLEKRAKIAERRLKEKGLV